MNHSARQPIWWLTALLLCCVLHGADACSGDDRDEYETRLPPSYLIHKYVIPKNYTLFKGYNHEYSIPD